MDYRLNGIFLIKKSAFVLFLYSCTLEFIECCYISDMICTIAIACVVVKFVVNTMSMYIENG